MDRLPRGRHGLSREFVARNQRDRLIAALTVTLAEVGYQGTTVSRIGRRASVSKGDFYEHFANKDDCFLAAYDHAVDRIHTAVVEACAPLPIVGWPARVRTGVAALLDLLAADPPLATLLLAEGLRAGPGIHRRYRAALEGFVPLLRAGAPHPPGGAAVPIATDEAVVGGVAALLGRRVVAGEAQKLAGLAPDVLEFVLAPHLGIAGARRIVSAG